MKKQSKQSASARAVKPQAANPLENVLAVLAASGVRSDEKHEMQIPIKLPLTEWLVFAQIASHEKQTLAEAITETLLISERTNEWLSGDFNGGAR